MWSSSPSRPAYFLAVSMQSASAHTQTRTHMRKEEQVIGIQQQDASAISNPCRSLQCCFGMGEAARRDRFGVVGRFLTNWVPSERARNSRKTNKKRNEQTSDLANQAGKQSAP
mmetsp:Transcript_16254/g.46133  ORF Transcript_16254/g.46133 Transcript_16254/m.46133 type:complete len:113 (-) Transcript_16254:81-419(-)